MSVPRRIVALLGLAVLFSPPVAAQPHRALVFHAVGGGFKGLSAPSRFGVYDTDMGYSLGGGVGFQVTESLAFRGDLLFSSSALTFQGEDTGFNASRRYHTAAIQVQTTGATVRPYGFIGGGVVRVDNRTGTRPQHTLGSGVGAIGLGYPVPGTPVVLRGELRTHLYTTPEISGDGRRVQWDTLFGVGVSYAWTL